MRVAFLYVKNVFVPCGGRTMPVSGRLKPVQIGVYPVVELFQPLQVLACEGAGAWGRI